VTVLSSATAPGFVLAELARGAGPAELIGQFRTACYLRLRTGAVVAVLTADAVRLPIGLVLPWTSGQLPLDRFTGPARAVAGGLTVGSLRVTVTERHSAALAYCGRPVAALPELADPFTSADAAVAGLLGRGSGLTPAGDDLLCGVLAAGPLFGADVSELAAAVRDRLAENRVTTSLSRQLLLRAAAGDGVPQLQRLGHALCSASQGQPDRAELAAAWRQVTEIGHSSGVALGTGLLVGAVRARRVDSVAAVGTAGVG